MTFLYRAVEGRAGGSFGLNVARLAGVPDPVLALAAQRAQAFHRATAAAEAEATLQTHLQQLVGPGAGVGVDLAQRQRDLVALQARFAPNQPPA